MPFRYNGYTQDLQKITTFLRKSENKSEIDRDLFFAAQASCRSFKMLLEETTFWEWVEGQKEIQTEELNEIDEFNLPVTEALLIQTGYTRIEAADLIHDIRLAILNRREGHEIIDETVQDKVKAMMLRVCRFAEDCERIIGNAALVAKQGSAPDPFKEVNQKYSLQNVLKNTREVVLTLSALISLGNNFFIQSPDRDPNPNLPKLEASAPVKNNPLPEFHPDATQFEKDQILKFINSKKDKEKGNDKRPN